jgi:ParB-like chromosome segregation protein Spo0J
MSQEQGDIGRHSLREAPAYEFLKTHAISGRPSSRKVMQLIKSMKQRGWVGPPVTAIEQKGSKYLVDGHHRVFAARKASIAVQYRLISIEELKEDFQYDSIEQVILAHAEARNNRVRLR